MIKGFLKHIFESGKNEAEVLKSLADNKFEIYKRGKSYGIQDLRTKRKYRLKKI